MSRRKHAAAAGGIIFCKVFGENILSFGGVCRHPIGDVTFGIIFCRAPNSTMICAVKAMKVVLSREACLIFSNGTYGTYTIYGHVQFLTRLSTRLKYVINLGKAHRSCRNSAPKRT